MPLPPFSHHHHHTTTAPMPNPPSPPPTNEPNGWNVGPNDTDHIVWALHKFFFCLLFVFI
ncbi:hypothetical protein L208DRAFT_1416183, partial [Tricholoma matsutake]